MGTADTRWRCEVEIKVDRGRHKNTTGGVAILLSSGIAEKKKEYENGEWKKIELCRK